MKYDPTVLDYERTDGFNEVPKILTWNVTTLVRQWYEGTADNYGIMLMSPSENSTYLDRVAFASSLHSASGARPVVQIAYPNNAGLEGVEYIIIKLIV